jgi:hypothetical protein
VKAASVFVSLAMSFGVSLGALAPIAGCGGSLRATESEPVVTVFPDDFVLRDVRKAAAPRLRCQVGMVDVAMGPWAGSSGNLIAHGCGYQITYYIACKTNHICDFSIAE